MAKQRNTSGKSYVACVLSNVYSNDIKKVMIIACSKNHNLR